MRVFIFWSTTPDILTIILRVPNNGIITHPHNEYKYYVCLWLRFDERTPNSQQQLPWILQRHGTQKHSTNIKNELILMAWKTGALRCKSAKKRKLLFVHTNHGCWYALHCCGDQTKHSARKPPDDQMKKKQTVAIFRIFNWNIHKPCAAAAVVVVAVAVGVVSSRWRTNLIKLCCC